MGSAVGAIAVIAAVLAATMPFTLSDRATDAAAIAAPFDAVTLSHWIGSEFVAFGTWAIDKASGD